MSQAKLKIGTKQYKAVVDNRRANRDRKCDKSDHPRPPKETIKVYDANGIRTLIVPDRNPIDLSGIWPKTEFNRLKNQAHVVTLQDKMTMLEEAERKKNELTRQCEQRKEILRNAQKNQTAKVGSKLSDIQQDAKRKNEYLLQRSQELMREQDDRVKAANGLILATKCRAIRNAQIAEKDLIYKQLQEEDHRLDMMMEQERQKQLRDAEMRKKVEEEKNKRYVAELTNQIRINETERLIEAERIEEESKMINRAFLLLQKEEEEKLRQKKENQQQIREELLKANQELERFKEVQREEERIADLRVKKFMKEKLARERALEEEQELAKAAREKEIARLRAQQERSQDLQAAVDEMNALRIQEEVEREWRQKELEAAKKRKDDLAKLRMDRQKQIDDLRKVAALRVAKDEEDFYKVVKVQKELHEKDLEKQKKVKEEAAKHRKDLLKQVNEKERERIMQQKERFEEGRLQKLDEQIRDKQIQEHLKMKIEKLRENKVPEYYVKEIENSLNIQLHE